MAGSGVNIYKSFMPRRGRKSTMAISKKDIILKEGELFLEYPDDGIGTGSCNFKIGDGITSYGDLPYAVKTLEDVSDLAVTFTANKSTTAANAVTNATSGLSIAKLIACLKRGLSLLITDVTTLKSNTVDSTLNGSVISSVDDFVALTAVAPLQKIFTFTDDTGWSIVGEAGTKYTCNIVYENSIESGSEINGRGILYTNDSAYIININGTSVNDITMSAKELTLSSSVQIQ